MRTLETYLASGGSTRRAAAQLRVHHRTISCRLQRVEVLTGLHLADQEDRLQVQLASKILPLEGCQGDQLTLPTTNTSALGGPLAGRAKELHENYRPAHTRPAPANGL